MSDYQLSKVEEAVEQIRKGSLVIVADNENRENEGDLICSAEKVTPEIINFMATEARGLICMPVSAQIAENLDLKLMCESNDDQKTAFTVSVDGSPEKGVGTGISAPDRARTIEICLQDGSRPQDLRRPGHVFPLIAREGGVIAREGQTEASIDLCKLAGLKSAGVICEILNPDGTMAKREQLYHFGQKFKIPFITVEQIKKYRAQREELIEVTEEHIIETEQGKVKIIVFQEKFEPSYQHLAAYTVHRESKETETLTEIEVGEARQDMFNAILAPKDKEKSLRKKLEDFLRRLGDQPGVFIYQTVNSKSSKSLADLEIQEEKRRKSWLAEQVLRYLKLA